MVKIVITGAGGFLGRHLLARLRQSGYDPFPVRSVAFDLRQPRDVNDLFNYVGKIDVLYHLAAHIGGIAYNIAQPASIYYDNVLMNTLVIDRAARAKVGKVVFAGSACSYPKYNPTPTREHRLWEGYPEESNGPYAIGKLAALAHLQACYTQHGLNYAYPVLANMYGSWDGGFFDDSKAHVIPALIRRFSAAVAPGAESVTVWGDGKPTRDFLYVEDAAAALARFVDIDYLDPVNIASGEETFIRQVVDYVAKYTGFSGKVVYDDTRPNGQLRRCYDTGEARRVLGWRAQVGIDEGLKRTCEWWKEHNAINPDANYHQR